MTHEEQNLEMAKLHGFTDIRTSKPWELWDEPPCYRQVGKLNGTTQELPDYLHDLNACHDAETAVFSVLTPEQWMLHDNMLDECTGGFTWHAAAPQRVEALLRTAGKWREDT
jgi:hypothetical protein